MNRQQVAPRGPGLVAKRDHLALLIASGKTIKAAALESGVGERTAHTWMKDAEYQASIAALRSRMYEEHLGQLVGLASSAIKTLGDLLKSEESDNVKARAALGILDQMIKVREHTELDARLKALEGMARDA